MLQNLDVWIANTSATARNTLHSKEFITSTKATDNDGATAGNRDKMISKVVGKIKEAIIRKDRTTMINTVLKDTALTISAHLNLLQLTKLMGEG